MAERRMFAKTIIDSDLFLDMPSSTQALYFHLAMRADDDGFINNPKKIQRMVGASDDDLRLLIAKSFIIPFDSGIVVIRHWKIHNYIQKDRYKPTIYQAEKRMISEDGSKTYTDCIHGVSVSETQVRLGKDRLGKSSLGEKESAPALPSEDTPYAESLKDSQKDATPKAPKKQVRHKYGEYSNVLLSDEELGKLKVEFPDNWQEWIERVSSYVAQTGKGYKNYLATIRNWARKDAEKSQKKSFTYNDHCDEGDSL